MIGTTNTRSLKCLLRVMQGAQGTSVSEEIAIFFAMIIYLWLLIYLFILRSWQSCAHQMIFLINWNRPGAHKPTWGSSMVAVGGGVTLRWKPGPWFNIKMSFTSIGNTIVEIRRSCDRLISTMWFPVLLRRHLCIESGPWPPPLNSSPLCLPRFYQMLPHSVVKHVLLVC